MQHSFSSYTGSNAKAQEKPLSLENMIATADQIKAIGPPRGCLPPKFLTSAWLTVTKSKQTFFSRSKKKRIVKKCAKKYRITWEEPDPCIYFLSKEGIYLGHRETVEVISRALPGMCNAKEGNPWTLL